MADAGIVRAEGSNSVRFGRIDQSSQTHAKLRRCRRTEAVRRGKGLSGLVGRVPTPLEEGG